MLNVNGFAFWKTGKSFVSYGMVWYGPEKKVDALRLMLQMIDVYCPIETKETVVRDSFFHWWGM